ncbi:MAG: hypothetical protein WCR42_10455 [bacterium]
MENKITIVQSQKCFIGALTSMLMDSKCSFNNRSDILEKVGDLTFGNATYILPEDLCNFINAYFNVEEILTFKEINQILDYSLYIDNINKYALLFWLGNNDGKNQHVTRYIKHEPDGIILMDPTFSNLKKFGYNHLQSLSTKGFKIVIINESEIQKTNEG